MSLINSSEVSNARDALDWLFNKIRTLMAKDIKINHASFPDNETVEDALDLLSTSKVNTSAFNEAVSLLNEDISTINSGLTQTNVELENKVNLDTAITWVTLPIPSGFNADVPPKYMKDQGGWVHFYAVLKKSTAPASSELVCTLPVGFRPIINMQFPCGGHRGNNMISWVTFFSVDDISGKVNFAAGSMPDGYALGSPIILNAVFKVQLQ